MPPSRELAEAVLRVETAEHLAEQLGELRALARSVLEGHGLALPAEPVVAHAHVVRRGDGRLLVLEACPACTEEHLLDGGTVYQAIAPFLGPRRLPCGSEPVRLVVAGA